MSNTNRKQATKLIQSAFYFCVSQGRVVRLLAVQSDSDAVFVKHHAEQFTTTRADLFIATKEEWTAYLGR